MAAEKAPAFQWYPRDFLSDGLVMRMSMTERGVYITLLSVCWLERDLPADMRDLSRIVGMPAKRFAKLWHGGPLASCFQPGSDGRLTHKRLEKERVKQEEHRRRSSDAGRASAASKATAGSVSVQPNGNQTATEAQPKSNSSSSSSSASSKEQKHGRDKAPPDPRVKEFLDWFPGEFERRRHGAKYLVNHAEDGARIKRLLTVVDLERLKKLAQILLSDKTDDEWIVSTDRGIGTLTTKFNWLNERLASWEARQRVTA